MCSVKLFGSRYGSNDLFTLVRNELPRPPDFLEVDGPSILMIDNLIFFGDAEIKDALKDLNDIFARCERRMETHPD